MTDRDSPFPPGARLFAYLRDSGHEDQELSIVQQEKEIQTWCVDHDLILDRIYTDKAAPGSSGEKRQQLAAMMNELRHGAQEAGVVVWSNSRFASNAIHAQFYRAEIRKLGYQFHSLTDKVVDGPEALIFEALIDYKNQQYLDDMSLDVKQDLHQLVEQFGCVPGVPPRGFKREKITIGHYRDGRPRTAHRWVPDPDVVPLIRQAFEMRAAGVSLAEIQRETRLYGSINSFRTFWPNKLYIGILEYGDMTLENYCEPIVPRSIFDAVQEIQNHHAGHHHLHADSHRHPRRVNSAYLLSGLVCCAKCGSPLFGRTSMGRDGKRYTSYFCTRAYRQRDCTKQRIPGKTLESAVIDQVVDILLQPDYLAAMRKEMHNQTSDLFQKQDAEYRRLSAELGKNRRQIAHLIDAIAAAGHTASLIKRLNELEVQQSELLNQQTALENQQLKLPAEIKPGQLVDCLAALRYTLATDPDIEARRSILQSLIERIDVDRDENYVFGTITCYYPPIDSPPKVNTPAKTGGMPIFRAPSGPQRKTT